MGGGWGMGDGGWGMGDGGWGREAEAESENSLLLLSIYWLF